ncbi:hypothetical protein K1W69_23235 [Hoeflea sp. WL0058]|uniref:Uncharacterized protein n=1 Tax=Flavimaribacter sediminis TaxID=2865987 RepID=A0AAE2ZP26_9HYPH|nr:hypothetical protein [Flavimaribacter sediminis]MBW8640128.1 hypothetical protein [Flavimaribacter sediminis]
MRLLVCAVSLVGLLFWPLTASAGTTGWIDFNNERELRAALAAAKHNFGVYETYKSIQCKQENGKVYVKVNYNMVMSGGFYGVMIDSKQKVDAWISEPEQKRLKIRYRSRSNVKTKNGTLSCVIWFRPAD